MKITKFFIPYDILSTIDYSDSASFPAPHHHLHAHQGIWQRKQHGKPLPSSLSIKDHCARRVSA
jgi:hypothetical protein